MIKEMLKYKHALLTRKVNFIKIPVTQIKMDDEGLELFNNIYFYVRDIEDIHKIVRTPSGGISIKRENLRLPAYDIRKNSYMIELTVLIAEGMWRFQFRNLLPKDEDGKVISGHKAFNIFKNLCLLEGINLNDYAIDNGAEIKQQIEKPLIKLKRDSSKDRTYENAHHIDFHNSYPAGLCNTHPEFRPIVEPLYLKRKESPINKAILNFTIGYMQSIKGCKARWAHLSKDAIHDNNKRILELTEKLENSDRVILAYNTDGIWYQGDIYHGEGEGKDLGQWENDHINCVIRFKSAGAYEFMENNTYKAVVRGKTRLDREKDRNDWQWGDIYSTQATTIKYGLDIEKGVFKVYEEENI